MIRKIREALALFLVRLATWVAPVPAELKEEIDIDPQVKKLIDAATAYPLPDRRVEAIKHVKPVVMPETKEEREALKEAIKSSEEQSGSFIIGAGTDPFEEEISKAIIDALKNGHQEKKEADEGDEE